MFAELNSMIRERRRVQENNSILFNAIVSDSYCSRGKSTEIWKSLLAIFFWFHRFRFRFVVSPSLTLPRFDGMSFVSFMAKSLPDKKKNVDKPVNVKEWKFLQLLLVIITVETSSGVLSRKMTSERKNCLSSRVGEIRKLQKPWTKTVSRQSLQIFFIAWNFLSLLVSLSFFYGNSRA